MKTIILLIILSTVCIAQVDRGTTLEQTLYTYEPSLRDVEILYPALEVRVCFCNRAKLIEDFLPGIF